MSNRIDFYNGASRSLSIPAGRAIVFIDGSVSQFLEVVEIIDDSAPEYGSARFRFDNTGYKMLSSKEPTQLPAAGKCVEVFEVYDLGEGNSIPGRHRIFIGQIENVDAVLDDSEDMIEVATRDYSAKMERITVSGRRVDDGDTGSRIEGSSLIFNEGGKGNASGSDVIRNGKKSRVFSSESSGTYWSCGAAVQYLLAEYIPLGELSVPPVELIDAVMGERICDELNVDSDSLLEALEKVCGIAGISMKFVPCGNLNRPRISFYRPGKHGQVELDMQLEGEELSLSKTQIASVKRTSSFWPVTHRYFAQGEKKVFETTFELVEAWDPALEGRTQAEYETSHADFSDVADVYRKWCLNETGEYSPAPYNRGDMYDLSSIDSQAVFLGGSRKFEDSISTDQASESYGVYVEVSYDAGVNWAKFDGKFENLSDQCGIRISDAALDDDYYNAAVSSHIRLRVTAAVESDERLIYSVADGPVNSVIEVCDHHIKVGAIYEYRKVCGGSIFYRDNAVIDDSEKLLGALRRSANRIVNIIETIDVETPFVRTTVAVGDRVISGSDGRDICGIRNDRRSVFWIDRAVMDFEKQTTRLRILRKRQFDV
ncbi:MAG: hypothetical protein K9M75_10065 [Phycisphaerae bacterium]|nr:hypothetical protein [Phycisphaerae bacterium]